MFSIDFRVDYIDTDAMGIVHHASYWRWFERSRIEWLRAQGLPYSKLESDGFGLPLMGASVEYLKSMKFDDHAQLTLYLEKLGPCSVDLRYELFCGGVLSTRARTAHVLCKRQETKDDGAPVSWKPTRIPSEWRTRWEQLKEKK